MGSRTSPDYSPWMFRAPELSGLETKKGSPEGITIIIVEDLAPHRWYQNTYWTLLMCQHSDIAILFCWFFPNS